VALLFPAVPTPPLLPPSSFLTPPASSAIPRRMMPDEWIPTEFLACCFFGAPSGHEEMTWRLSIKRPRT
jgi:hypothetical protein